MKILIVDDKEENLYLLETLLKGNDYETILAKNGVEALDKLRKESMDMIISDILMPKMDGFQLCRECKKNNILKKIPFIFYTATYTDKKDEDFALSLGADKFILKPQEPEAFLKILNEIIEKCRNGTLIVPKEPMEKEEEIYLTQYNERLVHKLEKKMLDLERAHKHLQEKEEKIYNLNQFQENIIHNANLWINVLDEKANVILWNEAAEKMSGYSAAEVIGHDKIWSWLYPDEQYRKKITTKVNAIIKEGEVAEDFETKIACKDGKIKFISWHSRNLANPQGKIIGSVALGRDITERKQAIKAIQENENRFRELFNRMSSGVAVYEAKDNGRDFIIKNFNRAAERIDKTKKEDIIGKSVLKVFPGVKDFDLFKVFQEVYNTGKPQQHPISFYKDQRITGWRENYVYKLPSGEIVAVYDDITERKQAEERIKHLSLILYTISNVNQIIIKETNREKLIKSICHTFIQSRGYHHAWIALLDEKGQLEKHAEAGLGKDFLPIIKQLKQGRLIACSQKALNQPDIVIIKDPESTCTDCPLAQKYSNRSAMVIRLEHRGKIYGFMSVSISAPVHFIKDKEEQDLFKEVADDIAVALYNIESEEERKQTEEKYRSLFESSKDGIAFSGMKGNFLNVNQAFLDMLGYRINEIRRLTYQKLLPKKWQNDIIRNQLTTRGYSDERELELIKKDGTIFPISIRVWMINNEKGKPSGMWALIRDVSERKKAEEETHRKTEDLALINALNDAVNRGDNLLEILQLLARETKRIFSCHGETVYLLSEDREYLVMKIFTRPPAMISRVEKLIGIRIPAISIPLKTGSLYQKTLQEKKPQLINDPKAIQGLMAEFTENKMLKKLIPKIYSILNTPSVINIPLISKGEALGLLEVSRKEPFTEFDLKRFKAISEQLTSIIEHKLAEKALKESRQLLNVTEKISKTGGWEYDIQSQKTTWTDEVYRIHEVPFDYGINIEKEIAFYKPEDQLVMERYFKKAIEDGEPYDLELPFITAKGKHLWVRTIGNPIQKNGKTEKIIGNIQDITERKATLREIEELAKFPAENPNPVFRISKDGTVLYHNYASESLLKQWHYKEGKPLQDRWFQFVLDALRDDAIKTVETEIGYKVIYLTFTPIVEKDFVNIYGLDISERKQAEEKLKKNMDATLDTISKIIEAKDPYTAGHQQRVSQLATAIAKELNLSQDKIEGIRIASLIHDIGKIGVPSEILSKPTKLTDIEYSLIRSHSQIGYNILDTIDFFYPIASIVLQHHEKLNGSGYPNNLKGDEIIFEAKIICVADVVEAMSSHRPYRPALGIDAALEEIIQNSGILYEPKVVDACLKLFKEKRFKLES